MDAPLTVYGSQISYFTGKFESYLRYKEIPYRYRALDLRMYYRVLPRALGATQFPSVQLADGRWMSDTTPMIAWLEQQHPAGSVMPTDPVPRYVALPVEDYADDWLWPPAMHLRWSFADDRRLAAASLAREVVPAAAAGGRPLLSGVPPDLEPLLREIGATQLEALDQNAQTHARGAPTRDLTVQGTTYQDVPTSAYRVWCLEQLRARFDALPNPARGATGSLLRRLGCWEPLWRAPEPASGHDPRGEAPFCRALRMVRD